jgi:hypothetical protein
MTKIPFEFTHNEIDLLVEALGRAASRHESESRYNPRTAAPHDKKALAMRKLKGRLLMAIGSEAADA